MIGVRHDDQTTPGASDALDVGGIQHGARADQRAFAERGGKRFDALQWLRRVQRHLDRPEAGGVQRPADGDRLVGLDAAQDRDQRQLCQLLLQGVHDTKPAARAIRNSPRAAASGTARRPRRPASSIAMR